MHLSSTSKLGYLSFNDYRQRVTNDRGIITAPCLMPEVIGRVCLHKAGILLPDFKEFDGIGVDIIGCDSCLLKSHPIFRSHCPSNRIRFLLCLSHVAFCAMIEINNRMGSI